MRIKRVCALPRGRDQRGVALVAAQHPVAREVRVLAELDVARDQELHARGLVLHDVPGLVEQVAHVAPRALVDQQVVALGDHQRHVARDGDRRVDRLLDLAPELRRVHHVLGRVAQAPQQRDVARGVERVRRALARRTTQPLELGLREVEAVHADQHGLVAELDRDRRSERRLPAARRPGDPEQRPAPAGGQPAGALERLLRGDHAVAAARCSSTKRRAEVASSIESSHVSRQMHSARVRAGDTTAEEKLSNVIVPS